MKKIYSLICILGLTAIILNSCKKKEDPAPDTTSPTPTSTSTIASLSTTTLSSVTYSTAISGGNITSDGGAAVTARGVCWNTSPSPVITGNRTNDGSGIGTFTSSITGLLSGTVYYVRSYATNSIGTSYGNQLTFTTTAPTSTFTGVVGQSYQGGVIAYILAPGDPGYSSSYQHGLIINSTSYQAAWGCEGTLLTGALGTAIGTGNQNTIDIMASCSTSTIAARVCGNLVSGGYSDWFLPSKDELNKIYLNKTTLGITDNNHWSSSQGNNNQSWSHNFTFGTQGYVYKSNQDFARPIRVY